MVTDEQLRAVYVHSLRQIAFQFAVIHKIV
jgi:hypothetical protein